MSPYIACLRVNPKYAFKTGIEGVEWWPVPLQQEVVVPQPLRQVLMVHHCPASIPYTPSNLFCLVICSGRDGEEVIHPRGVQHVCLKRVIFVGLQAE